MSKKRCLVSRLRSSELRRAKQFSGVREHQTKTRKQKNMRSSFILSRNGSQLAKEGLTPDAGLRGPSRYGAAKARNLKPQYLVTLNVRPLNP